MDDARDDILSDLAAVEAGELDALRPEQVARLEAHLAADPAAAERLAGCTPRADRLARAAAAAPSAAEWERVWERIEATTVATAPRGFRVHRLRFWGPLLAAAAACVLAVGLWTLSRAGSPSDWPVRWAHSVEIEELEVFEGGTALVLAADDDDTIPIIWVLENGG